MENKQLHESGLNIIQNSDGSYSFEWDPKDPRWSWLNGLTNDQLKVIVQESIKSNSLGESTDVS
jgi:hypothetical protein